MGPVAKDVVIHLINLCHDKYEIREYERKTALKLEDKPFSFPQDVREGNAFISLFKEVGTQYSRASGGKRHKAKCHIRNLSPEIRRRQMTLFNEKKDTGCRVNRCDRNGTQFAGQKNCISGGGKV